MNRKLTPERISRSVELMELNELILPVKAAAYNAKYAKDAINITDLMERNDTALAALEAVEKIRERCIEEIKHVEEYCEDMDDHPRGSVDMIDEILKILGGENEK